MSPERPMLEPAQDLEPEPESEDSSPESGLPRLRDPEGYPAWMLTLSVGEHSAVCTRAALSEGVTPDEDSWRGLTPTPPLTLTLTLPDTNPPGTKPNPNLISNPNRD